MFSDSLCWNIIKMVPAMIFYPGTTPSENMYMISIHDVTQGSATFHFVCLWRQN